MGIKEYDLEKFKIDFFILDIINQNLVEYCINGCKIKDIAEIGETKSYDVVSDKGTFELIIKFNKIIIKDANKFVELFFDYESVGLTKSQDCSIWDDTDGDGCHAGTDSDCGGIEGVDNPRITCFNNKDDDCDGMVDKNDDDLSCNLECGDGICGWYERITSSEYYCISDCETTEKPNPPIDLSNYPDMLIKDNRFNAFIVVGDSAPTKEVVGAADISMEIKKHYGQELVTKLASQVPDTTKLNIISVGSPCYNMVSLELMGRPADCTKGFKKGEGLIRLYNYNGYVQILVAGYSEDDTRKAAKVLANWKDYDLKGTEVRVTDLLTEPVPTAPVTPVEEEEEVTEIRVEPTPAAPAIIEKCNGCLIEDTCLPFGTRLVDEDISKYCGITKSLVKQKEKEATCQNNYECKTNQCSDGVCGSLSEELKETRGLLQQILDWIKKIFGG